MRVPYTIPTNTITAYTPSEQTLSLQSEEGRRLQAENFHWDEKTPRSLTQQCTQSLVDNFREHYRALSHLEPFDLDVVFETLPTALPLECVLPLIEDGIYWQRRCLDYWANMNDVTQYDNSWKRMFTERYLQDIIENEEPSYTDWPELIDAVRLCSSYVRRLVITQMKPPRTMTSIPKPPDLCSIEDFIPEHLDLSPFLIGLDNLKELSLKFGVKECGDKFTFKYFRMHVKDVERLAVGLSKSRKLRKLQITCSDIDDIKLNILLKALKDCSSLASLDFSHCKISDIGAKALSCFMVEKRTITSVCLQNNVIGSVGAHGIAHGLELLSLSSLDTLNLKLNQLGNEGGMLLASALASTKVPRALILSGTGLKTEAGLHLARMLVLNTTLELLDVSNNELAEAGETFEASMKVNTTLQSLDIRNCGIDDELEKNIRFEIHLNRAVVRKKRANDYLRSERKRSKNILGAQMNHRVKSQCSLRLLQNKD